jgi:hypothetical protein
MAHFEAVPIQATALLTEQLVGGHGHHSFMLEPLTGAEPAGLVAELAESFPVYLLPANRLAWEARTLRELAVDTGRIHHQIHVGGRPVAFVRSVRDLKRGWTVAQVAESDLVARLHEAMQWIDRNVHGDPAARALYVPAFELWAFWLLRDGGDTVVVACLAWRRVELTTEREIPEQEFLQALRSGQQVEGITTG